jgi:hypothetical protein
MTQIVEVIPAGDGELDAEEALWAEQCIIRHATDAYDEALLMEICGLTPYQRATPPTYMYGRKREATS